MANAQHRRTALVAVSLPGSQLALRLLRAVPTAHAHLPEHFAPSDQAGVRTRTGSLKTILAQLSAAYDELVVFGSVGMVVRILAPLVVDKRSDPAVVVVDDAGRFAVSLLSGHLGGANELARHVAQALGAQAVITTASDVLDTVAVDLLGRDHGWGIEGEENITRVSAALVNGEAVAIYQDAGERDWWPAGKPLPSNLVPLARLTDLGGGEWQAALIITDRLFGAREEAYPPAVVYRPRSLVVGVGCNRGATTDEIEAAVTTTLARHGLSVSCVGKLATIDIKRDEEGLQGLAARWAVPVEYYSAGELSHVTIAPNPSPTVHKWVGTSGVCEPAALLASGARNLVAPKTKTKNVAVAVARVAR